MEGSCMGGMSKSDRLRRWLIIADRPDDAVCKYLKGMVRRNPVDAEAIGEAFRKRRVSVGLSIGEMRRVGVDLGHYLGVGTMLKIEDGEVDTLRVSWEKAAMVYGIDPWWLREYLLKALSMQSRKKGDDLPAGFAGRKIVYVKGD